MFKSFIVTYVQSKHINQTYFQQMALTITGNLLFINYALINISDWSKTESHIIGIRKLSENGIPTKFLRKTFRNFCKFSFFTMLQFVVVPMTIVIFNYPISVLSICYRLYIWLIKCLFLLIVAYAQCVANLMILQIDSLNLMLRTVLSKKCIK